MVLVVVLFLWSSAFAGIRAGLKAYSPGQLALLRFLIASVVLAVYAGSAHFLRPGARDLAYLAIAGLVGIATYNPALNWGETRVSAGAASLLIASTPIWTAMLAVIGLREHLTTVAWGGILVSFVGVGLIANSEGEGLHFSPQALVILLAAILSGIYNVMLKHFVGKYTGMHFATIAQEWSLGFWCSAIGCWTSSLIRSPFPAFPGARGNGAMDIPCHPIFHFCSATRREWDWAYTTPSARSKPPRWSLRCLCSEAQSTQCTWSRGEELEDQAEPL